MVSRTCRPQVAEAVAAALGGDLTPGVGGAKVMALVRGEAEVYVHAGDQYEWDSAAPAAVARAAGPHTSRLDGSLLVPDLVVFRPELAVPVLAAVPHSPFPWARA